MERSVANLREAYQSWLALQQPKDLGGIRVAGRERFELGEIGLACLRVRSLGLGEREKLFRSPTNTEAMQHRPESVGFALK